MTNNVRITPTSPYDDISQTLIAEMTAEVAAIFGDDGSGLFDPADVTGPRGGFLIAWVNDEPAGCGALRPMAHDADIGEVKRMFVRPAYRGKGVAKQMLLALETLARGYAYQTLWLETGTILPAALALYTGAGYTQRANYGPYADDPLSICFEKQL